MGTGLCTPAPHSPNQAEHCETTESMLER
uniref:Uncharacterized protein n=1 Tax=Anguilla anguilla TaxID=7936 RepID=A0A0E9R7K3_ANGAN